MSETKTFVVLLGFVLIINALIFTYVQSSEMELYCPSYDTELGDNVTVIIGNYSDPIDVSDAVKSITSERCQGLPLWYYLVNTIVIIGLSYAIISSSNWL